MTIPYAPTFALTYKYSESREKKKILFLLPRRLFFFNGTLSQTLTLRAAFASSTYLLSQIPGPACLNPTNPLFKGAHQAFVRTRAHGHRFAVLRPASDDALFNPPIPLSKGAIRACGLSIATGFHCSPAPARHLMMPTLRSSVSLRSAENMVKCLRSCEEALV